MEELLFSPSKPLFKWQGVHLNFQLENTVLPMQEALEINLNCQEEIQNLGFRLRYEVDKLNELGTAEAQAKANQIEPVFELLYRALDRLTEAEGELAELAGWEEQSSQWSVEKTAEEARFTTRKRELLAMGKLPKPQPQSKPRKPEAPQPETHEIPQNS